MDLEDKDMDTEATTRETSKAKIKSEAKPSVDNHCNMFTQVVRQQETKILLFESKY